MMALMHCFARKSTGIFRKGCLSDASMACKSCQHAFE